MPRFTLPLLIVLFGFAVPLKAGDGVPTTVIVWPVADSDADENAQWMSGVLLGEFSKDSGLYLVDPQKVAGVLQYHVAMVGRAGTDNKEAAQSYLVLGKQHYFDLDYAASKAELLRAIELLQAESDHLFSEGALLLEAYLTLGLVQQAQNNDAEALDSFRQVLAIDPKYQLDAQSFAPSLVRLFSEAQKEKKGNGVIAVETDPKVAEVYCNGIYRGVSPVKISGLPSGEYALMIRTDHYREVRRWVTVSDEAPVAIKTKLEWQGAVQKSGPVAASQDGASRDGAVQTGAAQIAEGVRIADLLHVDKVVLVDVDESAESGQLTARMIDRQFRAGHNPVGIRYGADRSGKRKFGFGGGWGRPRWGDSWAGSWRPQRAGRLRRQDRLR